jgi:hypothetical protein
MNKEINYLQSFHITPSLKDANPEFASFSFYTANGSGYNKGCLFLEETAQSR